MKFITFRYDSKQQVGILSKDNSSVIPIINAGVNFEDMNSLIENITDNEMELLKNSLNDDSIETLNLDDITLLAPIPNPKQDMICLGINYLAHAEESARYKKEAFGGDRPYPVYFSKRIGEANTPNGNIPRYENIVDSLDYEAELAVVIKKDAKNVARENAYDYVFGYTIINDVSARNLQTQHKQWYFGKSLDGFTPMGPCIVTKDEFVNPPALNIRSKVNGEIRQDSNTNLMIHSIDYVINELSQGMTLKSGTIIATGTPAGVGMGFQPPKFLNSGDVVECEIEGIGCIRNVVK